MTRENNAFDRLYNNGLEQMNIKSNIYNEKVESTFLVLFLLKIE